MKKLFKWLLKDPMNFYKFVGTGIVAMVSTFMYFWFFGYK